MKIDEKANTIFIFMVGEVVLIDMDSLEVVSVFKCK